MNKTNANEEEKAIQILALAFDDLPILARLEFISNVICTRAGESGNRSRDKALAVADQVLDEVIRVLRTVPNLDELRGPL
jgi:hypothetical protein